MRSHIIGGSASRQGLILGLLSATTTWLWVAAIDAMAGRPFHTFSVLGGIADFTLGHYVLNIGYATAVVAIARGTAGSPSLVIGAIFGFIILEVGFAMITAILAEVGLGATSWLAIFGGSLISAAILLGLLIPGYDLRTRLHDAEAER